MKSHTVITASCLLGGILVGCDCPKCPEPTATTSSAPSTSAVTAAASAATAAQIPPCVPSGPQGPQSEVMGGTYCVCNAGDHDQHGSVKGPHLAKGQPVVVPDPDMVTDVTIGGTTVPMILALNKKEMNGLGNFSHQGGNGSATHLVRIIPVTLGPTPVAGCLTGKNTLKILFCTAHQNNGKWGCRPPDGDFGDTHVQN